MKINDGDDDDADDNVAWEEKVDDNDNNLLFLPSKITSTNTIINNISKYLEGTGT